MSAYSPTKDKVDSLFGKAKMITATAQAENRDLSEAEYEQLHEHLSEIKGIRKGKYSASEEGDLHAIDKAQIQRPLVSIDPERSANEQKRSLDEYHVKRGLAPIYGTSYETDGRSSGTGERSYRGLFGEPQGNDGFGSLGEFMTVLDSGRFDQRMQAATMVGGTDSLGGFLVPEQFAAQMLDKSLEDSVVLSRCHIHPMKSDTLKIAGFDSLDHSSHLYGGLTASWTAEGATPDTSNAKVRAIKLVAKKLFCLVQSSNELLADGMNFERDLPQAMINALGWYSDEALLVGNGAGQPLGVLNDPALVTVSKVTNQTSGTLWYSNVAAMLARLHPACYPTSVWVANPTVIPSLLELVISAGSGGQVYDVLQESNGQYSLLGRPVVFTEKLPALGTKGDIVLADFSQYSVGLRKEITCERSGHAGFGSDTSWFRSILRCDGQGRWSKPLTPKNGDSLSWCVALETRS